MRTDERQERDEESFMRGERAALLSMLQHVLRALGYDSDEGEREGQRTMISPDEILAKVREARTICDGEPWGFIAAARTGWPEALDIIEQLVARVQEAEEIANDALEYGSQAMQRKLEALAPHIVPVLPPEPPPGKMRVTASVPITYDVSPGQIAAYLRAKGWEHHYELVMGADYYRRDMPSMTTSEVLLVSDPSYANRDRRAQELLGEVAAVECRSTGEILRDIASMEEA